VSAKSTIFAREKRVCFMEEEKQKKTIFHKLKRSKVYELLGAIIKSAAVGMLFAVICFVYDVYQDSEQDKKLEESVNKLASIEQNLSTRYLGIFPEYVSEIGILFDRVEPSDTIVIFEDVLYYGIKSRPKEFYHMNVNILDHVMKGGSVTVAYYNIGKNDMKPTWENIFHKMVVESRIDTKYHTLMNELRRNEFRKLRETHQITNQHSIRDIDSTLCEKYFSATRDDDPEKFKKDVVAYLNNTWINDDVPDLTPAEKAVNQMCIEIDSVKQRCLGNGKAPEQILFYDYEQMYRQMSEVIVKYYTQYGVEMIPLDEYLTMSCWMVQKGNRRDVRTVLAFPSKYSTDEIGFYSQDEAFSRYIRTMLEGVKENRRSSQEN
jgi:DNA gyrase inhibitor GyrI